MTNLRGVAGALVAGALLLVAVLHVTSRSVDPVRDMLSDYARTGHGVAFGAATLLLAAGSALLLPWRRSAKADVAFGAWCAGLVVLAFFRRDVIGGPPTAVGRIHLVAAVVALAALPLGVLAVAGRRRRALRRAAWACLALLTPLIAGFFLGPPLWDVVGLTERLLLAADVALIAAAAQPAPAVSAASRPACAGRRPRRRSAGRRGRAG